MNGSFMFNCRTHRVPIYPWYFSPSPPSPWTDKRFLDALTSLDPKLSVSQSVIDVFRLAHLRVFQSYFYFCKIDWTALARAQARSLGHIKTRQTGGGWFKEIFSLGVQKFFTAVQLLFMADLGKTSVRQQSLVI